MYGPSGKKRRSDTDSRKREQLIYDHKQRAIEKAVKVLRGDATFKKLQATVGLICIRAGSTLNPVAPSNSYTLKILKKRLTAFALAFPNLKHTERGVIAFTAACLQRMAVGHTVHGVNLFKRSPFVAAHAPAEISHTVLCNIPCRQVSAAHRLIISEMIGPSGLPRPERAFSR